MSRTLSTTPEPIEEPTHVTFLLPSKKTPSSSSRASSLISVSSTSFSLKQPGYHALYQPSWREQLAVELDSSEIGSIWKLVDAFLNILLCLIYIAHTGYMKEPSLPTFNVFFEIVVAILLVMEYVPKFYIYEFESWKSLFTKVSPILTALTVYPVFAIAMDPVFKETRYIVFFYPFRFIRCYLSVRDCLVRSEKSVLKLGQVTSKTLIFFSTVLFLILAGSSLLHGVEYAYMVVILNPLDPTDRVKTFLSDPVFAHRVQYIRGSSLDARNLEKVDAKNACAYFILAKKYTQQSEIIDAENVLKAIALSKFDEGPRLYIQCILPENKIHFESLNPEQIICIDELKLAILAHSCLTPGFSTLLYGLTTSFTFESAHELRRGTRKRHSSVGLDSDAIEDYITGFSQSIYTTTLSDHFSGHNFLTVTERLYEDLGVVLFALGIPKQHSFGKLSARWMLDQNDYDVDGPKNYTVLINPDDYILNGNEIGFVIALDGSLADGVSTYEWRSGQKQHKVIPVHPEQQPLLTNDILRNNSGGSYSDKKKESINSVIDTITGHILLCDYSQTTFPRNLDCFVSPLRKPYLEKITPIVILSPARPTQSQWKILCQFDQDASAMLVFLNIKAMCKKIDVFVEFVHMDNMKFMSEDASAIDKSMQAHHSPAFMAGTCFSLSMLDSIICQSFYQPHIVTIIEQMLFGAPPLHLLSGSTCPAPSHSHFYQIPIHSFVGYRYGELFRSMVQKKVIPLGLYRTKKVKTVNGNEKELKYVYACPKSNVLLRDDDKVFVLSKKLPT
ncbi:19125_t:CDS:2, partial [Racocetra fulgida]